MFGNSMTLSLSIVGISILIGALRFWMSYRNSTRALRISRIADTDAHLSFDERIAERMRDLEREGRRAPIASATPDPASGGAPLAPATSGPTGAVGGFGRRGV